MTEAWKPRHPTARLWLSMDATARAQHMRGFTDLQLDSMLLMIDSWRAEGLLEEHVLRQASQALRDEVQLALSLVPYVRAEQTRRALAASIEAN